MCMTAVWASGEHAFANDTVKVRRHHYRHLEQLKATELSKRSHAVPVEYSTAKMKFKLNRSNFGFPKKIFLGQRQMLRKVPQES